MTFISTTMKNNQQNEEEEARLASIRAAMMEELGLGRKDDLPLQDKGLNISMAQLPQAPPQRALPSAVAAWNNVVFDDIDPSQDQLDSIGDGQLYRMRKQAQDSVRQSRGDRSSSHGRGGFANLGNRGHNGHREARAQSIPDSSSMHSSSNTSGRTAIPAPCGSGRVFASKSSRIDKTVARLRAKSKRARSTIANDQTRHIANGHNGRANHISDSLFASVRQRKPKRLVELESWTLLSADTFSLSPMPPGTPPAVQASLAPAAPIQPTPTALSEQLPAQPQVLPQPAPVTSPAQPLMEEVTPAGGSASQTIQIASGGGLGASRWAVAVPAPPVPYQPQEGRFNSEWAHPARSAQSGRAVPTTVAPTTQPSNRIEVLPSQSSEGEEEVPATSEAPKLEREEVRTFSADVRIDNGPFKRATIRLTRKSHHHHIILEICFSPGMQRAFFNSIPVDAGLQLQSPIVAFRHNDPAGMGLSDWTILFSLNHYAEALYGLITTDPFRPATGMHDVDTKQVRFNMRTAIQSVTDGERTLEEGRLSVYPSTVSDYPSKIGAGQSQSEIARQKLSDLQAIEDGDLINLASEDEEPVTQQTISPASDDLKILNDDLIIERVLQQLDTTYGGSFLNSLFAVVEKSAKNPSTGDTLGFDAPLDTILLSGEHLRAARVLVTDCCRDVESYMNTEEETEENVEEHLSDLSWKVLAKALLIRDDGIAKPEDSETEHAHTDPIVQDQESSPPSAEQDSTEKESTIHAHIEEGNKSSRVIYQEDELLTLRPNAVDIHRVLLSRQDMMLPYRKKTPQFSDTKSTAKWNSFSNSGLASKPIEIFEKADGGQEANTLDCNGEFQPLSTASVGSATAEKPTPAVPTPTTSVHALISLSDGASERDKPVSHANEGDTQLAREHALRAVAGVSEEDDKPEPTAAIINPSRTEQAVEKPKTGKHTPSNSRIGKLTKSFEELNLNSELAPGNNCEPVNSSPKGTSSRIPVQLPTGCQTLQLVKIEASPSKSGGFHGIIPADFSGNTGLAGSRWAPQNAKPRTESKPSSKALPPSTRQFISQHPRMASLVIHNPDAASNPTSPVNGGFRLAGSNVTQRAATPLSMQEVVDEATGQIEEVKKYMQLENPSMTKQENVRFPLHPPRLDKHRRNLSESSDIDSFSQQGIKEARHSRGCQDAGGMGQSRPALTLVPGNGSLQAELQSRLNRSLSRR